MFITRRPSGERGDNLIVSPYTNYSPFTASCLLIAIMQSQELDFLQMHVLSDRHVPLAIWVAQPAKKGGVGSDRRARRQCGSSLRVELHRRSDPTDCRWKKMRPGSIEVSGNKKKKKKKRRPAHTETRSPGPDVLGTIVFIPRRPSGGRVDNFPVFSYTSYSPFTASCLLTVIMQSQQLDWRTHCLLAGKRIHQNFVC